MFGRIHYFKVNNMTPMNADEKRMDAGEYSVVNGLSCVSAHSSNRRPSALNRRLSASCIFVAMLAMSATAHADEFKTEIWVNPGIYSRHFDRGLNYREKNWGFGVEARVAEEHSAMVGSFINSERERSRYLAWHWRPLSWDVAGAKVSAGLIAGAFDGYPRYKNGNWFPAAMPVMSVEKGRLGVNFSILPDIPNRMSGAVAVQVKLKLW